MMPSESIYSSSMILVGQSEKITSWLTPVWTLSVGIAAGFVIVIVAWLLLIVLGRIGGLNKLHGTVAGKVVAVLIAAGIFSALYFGFSGPKGYWLQGENMSAAGHVRHLIMMSVFYVGGSLAAGFGIVASISTKRSPEIVSAPRDGFLYWISIICMLAIVFSVLGVVLAKNDGFNSLLFVEKPNDFFESLPKVMESGEKFAKVELKSPSPEGGQFVPGISFDVDSIRMVRAKSNQPFEFSARPFTDKMNRGTYIDFPPSDEYRPHLRRGETDPLYAGVGDQVDGVYFMNRGSDSGEVSFQWITQPTVPQAGLMFWAAGSVIILFLAYFFFVAGLPKVFAIAQSTFKTEVSQPVFLILLIIGGCFVVASIYFPYYTFGEDIKMYKDSGLTLLRVLGIFMAVWAASKSLAEEIEGRTALTVLSKPVSRRQFIVGKYVGIGMAIALLFILIGVLFYVCTAYKPIYDSAESTVRDFTWQTCHREAASTIPGLLLAWLEAMIFVGISVVISTRLGILANFMICFSIYILGHLTPLIVQSAEVAQSFEGVVVFGQLISIIFPVLDHFDINAAITGGVDVPVVYLGWSAIYCALYGLIALLLALVLFEDRDLA